MFFRYTTNTRAVKHTPTTCLFEKQVDVNPPIPFSSKFWNLKIIGERQIFVRSGVHWPTFYSRIKWIYIHVILFYPSLIKKIYLEENIWAMKHTPTSRLFEEQEDVHSPIPFSSSFNMENIWFNYEKYFGLYFY